MSEIWWPRFTTRKKDSNFDPFTYEKQMLKDPFEHKYNRDPAYLKALKVYKRGKITNKAFEQKSKETQK